MADITVVVEEEGLRYQGILIPFDFLDALTEYKLTQECVTYVISVRDFAVEATEIR